MRELGGDGIIIIIIITLYRQSARLFGSRRTNTIPAAAFMFVHSATMSAESQTHTSQTSQLM
jgi:hypothetical protein